MSSISAHGRTYQSIEQARARVADLVAENDQHGASDGRVTEILLIEEAIAAASPAVESEPVYEVVKEEYGMPCEHPACAILHRHLAKEAFSDGGTHRVDVYHNGRESQVQVNRWHEKTIVEWVVLRDGKRVGNAWDTKREALAEAAKRPTI